MSLKTKQTLSLFDGRGRRNQKGLWLKGNPKTHLQIILRYIKMVFTVIVCNII